MTLDDVKKGIHTLREWVDALDPATFKEQAHLDALSQIQGDLTHVNTKVGEVQFKAINNTKQVVSDNPNDPQHSQPVFQATQNSTGGSMTSGQDNKLQDNPTSGVGPTQPGAAKVGSTNPGPASVTDLSGTSTNNAKAGERLLAPPKDSGGNELPGAKPGTQPAANPQDQGAKSASTQLKEAPPKGHA
jgi:hypothetical protein